jgi:hypothetical protein
MTGNRGTQGEYVPVYLSRPILAHVRSIADKRGMSIAGFIRKLILETCPDDVREAAELAGRFRHQTRKPSPGRPSTRSQDTDLVADLQATERADKQKVLELAAKGYGDNAIAAIAKLPYRLVQAIVAAEGKTSNRQRRPR